MMKELSIRRLKRGMAIMSRRAEPDRAFVRALKTDLVGKKPRNALFFAFRTAGALLIIALALGSASCVYACRSPKVLPGHPLYILRMGVENAERSLVSGNPERAARVAVKHFEKRVEEIEIMADGGREMKDADVRRVMRAAEDAIQSVPCPLEAAELDERIQQAELSGAEALQRAAEASEDLKPAIRDGVKQLGRMVYRMPAQRRAAFQNIELRYEAEAFGMNWKVERGNVLVEEKNVDEIIERVVPNEDIEAIVMENVEKAEKGTEDVSPPDVNVPPVFPSSIRPQIRAASSVPAFQPPIVRETVPVRQIQNRETEQNNAAGTLGAFGGGFQSPDRDAMRLYLQGYFTRLREQGGLQKYE